MVSLLNAGAAWHKLLRSCRNPFCTPDMSKLLKSPGQCDSGNATKRCAGWWKADLPFEGEYDLENVGRTPNVVSGEE